MVAIGRAHDPQVDIGGAAGSLKAQLDGETALQGHRLAQLERDAGEEAVEHYLN